MFLSTKGAVQGTCDIHNRTQIGTYRAGVLQCLAVLRNWPMLFLLLLVLSPGLQCVHIFYNLGKLHSWSHTQLPTV